MILWCDGAHAAAENMTRDAALLAAAEQGAEPVLRLFRFEPAGITLGFSQDPERELDLGRCRRDGIGWAVRPTGGRAILHAEEWTYSLAAPLADPQWGGGLEQAYSRVAALLGASLLSLGVPVEFAAGVRRGGGARPSGGRHAAPPCFASTARHELLLAGRKLVGSAQRRTGDALLQQGSVLLGEGHLRLSDYLRVEESRRPSLRAALASGSAHAGAVIPPDTPLARWGESLIALLPAGTRRFDGSEGAGLLTPPERDSYTRAST